jgi:hypothetical protein
MIPSPLVYTLLGAGGALAVKECVKYCTQYKRLTIDDVLECVRETKDADTEMWLRPVGLPKVDLESDQKLLMLGYRREQRSRFLYVKEEYQRIEHNGLLLKNWSHTEWYGMVKNKLVLQQEVVERLSQLCQLSTSFCRAMQIARLKIRILDPLHFADKLLFIPLPSVVCLRHSTGLDIPAAYKELKEVAVRFALAGYGSIGHFLARELGVTTSPNAAVRTLSFATSRVQ